MKANKENIKTFEIYGVFIKYDKNIYTCVLCGRKTSIDASSSENGHKLICSECVYKYFGNYSKAREWQTIK